MRIETYVPRASASTSASSRDVQLGDPRVEDHDLLGAGHVVDEQAVVEVLVHLDDPRVGGFGARGRDRGRLRRGVGEPVLVVERDEPPRALREQPRLLAAAEVAGGVHEVGCGLVVARRQRLRLAVLVLPRHELADRAAVAARREPAEVVGDEPVHDEMHPRGLVQRARARHT